MEVYITKLDSHITDLHLKASLAPHLKAFKIEIFEVSKRAGGTVAWLTIASHLKASAFLASVTRSAVSTSINPSGQRAFIQQSNKAANPQLLRVLQKEEKDLRGSAARRKLRKGKADTSRNESKDLDKLPISSFSCGSWETGNRVNNSTYQPYHSIPGPGHVTTRGRTIIIVLERSPQVELHIDVSTITSLVLSPKHNARVAAITLALAPKILESCPLSSRHQHIRGTTLPGADTYTTGSCLTYYLNADPQVMSQHFEKHLSSMMYSVATTKIERLHFSARRTTMQEAVNFQSLGFKCKFQIQALWANAILSPMEIRNVVPVMQSILDASREQGLTKTLQRLISQLREADYHQGGHREASSLLRQLQESNLENFDDSVTSRPRRDEVSVHRVVVTPTGMYLYGPEEIAANRVLRQYRKYSDCFVRVTFADEDEGRIPFDRDISNEEVLRGRFLDILRNGLDIAGEHFDFLGFSHSSLRSQSCWFMRPFFHSGTLLFAAQLVKSLGDFDGIRCAAKCAARIGQAFSETTSAVRIDPDIVSTHADIRNQQYVFTDGCGTISRSVWRTLKSATSSKEQPTAYQIRYQGAKGMISLDSRLRGNHMYLRESMVKFRGSPANDIEICGTNARPLPFKLNRQLIKILEDLNVQSDVFEDLQVDAVEKLRSSATSRTSAIDFLKQNLSDSATGLATLLRTVSEIKFDVTEDAFLRELLGALLQVELRDLKYRSRILVPDALTLYGISDESAVLKEGEIFVTYADTRGKHRCLVGQVAITRSPALHPGDIQVVAAVVPPEGSHLWKLRNCVVFSQQGQRDLPSMLSGGDLDGDIYNIIYDRRLIPKITSKPASYAAAKPVDLDRPVTTDDMTEFFVDFMQNDQLARIAILHQVFADGEAGTRSEECLKLAELHSTAVDFSKTGIPVDVTQIPRAPKYRPDFMAPSTSVQVEKGIKRPSDLASPDPDEPQRFRYYESQRVLGRLFRAIDEDIFFDNLEDDISSLFSADPNDNVLRDLLRVTEGYASGYDWQQYIDIALEVKEYYEYEMLDIMTQYAPTRTELLSEKEVWIGKIVGRSGAGSKFQREQSDYMKSRFNRGLRDIKEWMNDKMKGIEEGFVSLAVACLHVAVRNQSILSTGKLKAPLESFGWFAAAMCLPDLVSEQYEKDSMYANHGDDIVSPFEALQLGGARAG